MIFVVQAIANEVWEILKCTTVQVPTIIFFESQKNKMVKIYHLDIIAPFLFIVIKFDEFKFYFYWIILVLLYIYILKLYRKTIICLISITY